MDAAPPDRPIELFAIDAARNIRRRYRISVDRDLFGGWVVETAWGRIGAAGACARHLFEDQAAAARFVHRTLARRASSPRRIGVAYRRAGDVTPPH
ncbi:WGR domain-containing protein [Sphingomonas sp. ID1715]|uniref:WGR domain-containing protein n=1 Tax=Sphingomonas sp. ID1715 TaxID=1656898 RepID=UPI001488CDCB|nr:WGR domain-containing protein [Sphingomonas sp. ID1715]NNM78610.1 WGR domain-containing protein [Sphingomonas sp. ID1715]